MNGSGTSSNRIDCVESGVSSEGGELFSEVLGLDDIESTLCFILKLAFEISGIVNSLRLHWKIFVFKKCEDGAKGSVSILPNFSHLYTSSDQDIPWDSDLEIPAR